MGGKFSVCTWLWQTIFNFSKSCPASSELVGNGALITTSFYNCTTTTWNLAKSSIHANLRRERFSINEGCGQKWPRAGIWPCWYDPRGDTHYSYLALSPAAAETTRALSTTMLNFRIPTTHVTVEARTLYNNVFTTTPKSFEIPWCSWHSYQ